MRFAQGTYTGDGRALGQSFALPFVPKVVITYRRNTNHCFWSSDTMASGTAYQLNGQHFQAAAIVLGNGFFTVKDSTYTNTVGQVYDYWAFGADADCIKTGTYTGNGTGQTISGVGWTPDFVLVQNNYNDCAAFHPSQLAGDNTYRITYTTGPIQGAITALNSDGFVVGNSQYANCSARPHHWLCLKAKTGAFALGSYDGNDADNRNIVPSDAFAPTGVWVIDSVLCATVLRDTGHAGDLSTDITGSTVANYIQAFNADGFQVGTQKNVANSTYHYFAFKDTPPEWADNPPGQIGQVACSSGYEWLPSFYWPYQRAFVGNDGCAVVVYHYWMDVDSGNGTLYVCWRFSNADRSQWSEEHVILRAYYTNTSEWLTRTAAVMDTAGDVHVGILRYPSSTNRLLLEYCKLTKTVGGWSAGTVNQIRMWDFDLSGNDRMLAASYDGQNLFFPGYWNVGGGRGLIIYYTANEGGAWNVLSATPIANLSSGSPTIAIDSGGGKSVVLYQVVSPSTKIVAAGWSGASWAGRVTADLWTDAALVDATYYNYTYGLHALYVGLPDVDFVIIAKLKDGSQRLRKWKDGLVGNEVILKASGTANRWTHAFWDPDSQLVVVWYDGTHSPQTYNPVTDEIGTTQYSVNKQQIVKRKFGSSWGRFYSSGSGGVSTLYWFEEQMLQSISRKAFLPLSTWNDWLASSTARSLIETTGGAGRRFTLPFQFGSTMEVGRTFRTELDWIYAIDRTFRMPFDPDGVIERIRKFGMPLEPLTALADPRAMPLEWSAGLLKRPYLLPVELGQGAGRILRIPFESVGENWLVRRLALPVESWLQFLRSLTMPVEVSGLQASLVHRWNVIQPTTGVVLHEWTVIATAEVGSLLHEWSVWNAMNAGLVHTWRVLPGEIVSLYSSDIQLPFGEVDKTS